MSDIQSNGRKCTVGLPGAGHRGDNPHLLAVAFPGLARPEAARAGWPCVDVNGAQRRELDTVGHVITQLAVGILGLGRQLTACVR